MGFLSVVHSDRGIKKNTNQDSVLIKEASTDYGDVMLAVVSVSYTHLTLPTTPYV